MMNRHKKAVIVSMVLVLLSVFAVWALAGDLDPQAGPSSPGSAMYTLTDIYNRLVDNTAGTKRIGAFTEPGTAPGSTGYTLDEIYDVAIPTQVPKTGETGSYATGDDGDHEAGIAWPDPRFTDNGDGAVTDNLTGLIWLQNADRNRGIMDWAAALAYCNSLADDGSALTDGSVAGDWRLPNIKELQSLIDFSNTSPALPSGHPFSGVSGSGVRYPYYWSSTTGALSSRTAWRLLFSDGRSDRDLKGERYLVWPVRGGN